MGITAVLQARMSSTRLPGKVLAEVAGLPMIHQQLRRIENSRLIDNVIVATSSDPSDDILVDQLKNIGMNHIRGALDDVLGRFVLALDTTRDETCVRLTGDCPLSDPEIIDKVISQFIEQDVDYASNTLVRSYPRGLDVEVIRSDVIREQQSQNFDPLAREHVTYGIYTNPSSYSLHNVSQVPSYAHYRWTVDTPADLAFIRNVFDAFDMNGVSLSQENLISWLEANPNCIHLEDSQN